ncbi:type VI secretion system baseplate subunit TssG [Shewanella sp. 202IG2-18]|uniref:type VI secretion system baseplate subunit TssG n=1 Tax=Parashewanella hymeniacidonis TaxID=2807618 RepID=UPI00195F627F|nr:type VI secretion system baseplate subunit TssG [Parashewanella hymeniacidonis]MBM7071363.1 type VI secretion system baseplate subunit TssG [Parashewanella hymeniacidonis]
MQKLTLTKLIESADGSELAKTWQLLRHHAEYTNSHLKVRFSSEVLPAYHHSEVTKVYQHPRAGWIIKTGLPALTGSKGSIVRPLYRQLLNAQFNLGDDAPIDFFDSFNHRFYSFYCRVEQKHDLLSLLEEERFKSHNVEHAISSLLVNLSGAEKNSNIIPKDHLIQYSSLIGLRITCIGVLKKILEDYFETCFEIENSDLEYQPLTMCSLTAIGNNGQNAQLGTNALVGTSAPVVGQRLRIKICPANYLEYIEIHSDQKLVKTIDYIVRSFMGVNIKYKLFMKADSHYLPRIKLSKSTEGFSKIGESAWMDSRASSQQYVELPLSAG